MDRGGPGKDVCPNVETQWIGTFSGLSSFHFASHREPASPPRTNFADNVKGLILDTNHHLIIIVKYTAMETRGGDDSPFFMMIKTFIRYDELLFTMLPKVIAYPEPIWLNDNCYTS